MKPLIILPKSAWSMPNPKELWHYRELLSGLVLRDIRVRYKQTLLGALWAILQPLITMLIFTVVFSLIARFPSNGFPYAVFVMTGILPWLLFSGIVTSSSNSLVASSSLIKKVYFPRIFLPLSSIGVHALDFVLAFILLTGLLIYFNLELEYRYLLASLVLLPVAMLAVGIGALFSSLIVLYRDFRFVVPFIVQSLFFLSPVIYSSSMIPQKFSWISLVNPMSGYIGYFRGIVLGIDIDYTALVFAISLTFVVFVTGATVFSLLEERFADII